MSTFEFHQNIEMVTPRLQQAVGRVVIDWAVIDDEITQMRQQFFPLGSKAPLSVARRIVDLRKSVEKLLGESDPAEHDLFSHYADRLSQANDGRNALAHGQPGNITQNGATYFGLMVPFPGKPLRLVPMSMDDIERLGDDTSKTQAWIHERGIFEGKPPVADYAASVAG